VPLSMLFRQLPAAVLKARINGGSKPRRKRPPDAALKQ
jgi:hypothetical protein